VRASPRTRCIALIALIYGEPGEPVKQRYTGNLFTQYTKFPRIVVKHAVEPMLSRWCATLVPDADAEQRRDPGW
jgi:hypothetical protein